MSPALLSQRLKELEAAGIVQRSPAPKDPDVMEYSLTDAGRDVQPVVASIGTWWGQRWVESELTLENLDVGLLMWDMRRCLDPNPLPPRRSIIQFTYPDQARAKQRWWLIADPGVAVDLCRVEPGFDVNFYVSVDLRTMTEIWLGLKSVERARQERSLTMVGERDPESAMQSWLGLSPFATVDKRVP